MLRRMNEATVQALNALNRAFYAVNADEWQAKRAEPWPGFARVLEAALARSGGAPLRVLDVGAGDGRFGEFLCERSVELQYTGVDASAELLARAAARTLTTRCKLVHADVVEEPQWLPALGLPPQSLVTLFGVMHHVPSLALRKQLLATLAQALAPNALLAVTFWRLHHDARFSRRVVPFAAYNASAREPIPESEFERGDSLLGFGEHDGPVRYCHFADDAEIEALVAASGLSVTQRFRSDGRGGALNDYLLLARHPP